MNVSTDELDGFPDPSVDDTRYEYVVDGDRPVSCTTCEVFSEPSDTVEPNAAVVP